MYLEALAEAELLPCVGAEGAGISSSFCASRGILDFPACEEAAGAFPNSLLGILPGVGSFVGCTFGTLDWLDEPERTGAAAGRRLGCLLQGGYLNRDSSWPACRHSLACCRELGLPCRPHWCRVWLLAGFFR